MATIRMTFEPGEHTEIKVIGQPGASCRTLSKAFIDLLGGNKVSDKETAEMHNAGKVLEANKLGK